MQGFEKKMPSDQGADAIEHQSIARFGADLRRMTHEDIQLVREWRNLPEVAANMEYREEISPQMQEEWYAKIDEARDYYYVAYQEERPVGLVSIKNVDIESRTGFGGVFLDVRQKVQPFLGLRSMLAMYHFGFADLGLDRIEGKILAENEGAKRLNRMLGFEIEAGQEGIANQSYILKRERFMECTRDLRARFEGDDPG